VYAVVVPRAGRGAAGWTLAGEALRVGVPAKRTELSVRTLHYYDEIGLLRRSQRSAAGYRRSYHTIPQRGINR